MLKSVVLFFKSSKMILFIIKQQAVDYKQGMVKMQETSC